MKTLQELYNEITADEELKMAYITAARDGDIPGFLKVHGVEASEDDIKAFFDELSGADMELSEEELENAAGGGCNKKTRMEVFESLSMILCAVDLLISATDSDGHVGQHKSSEGRLCSSDK